MVKCKNELLLKMGTPPDLSQHNVVGHKYQKSDIPPSTASFYIMIGIVLFLILHIYTGAKDTNSSKEGNMR